MEITENTSDNAKQPRRNLKFLVWIFAIPALLVGSFIGTRAFLISSAVASYQNAFDQQEFETARKAIEDLERFDSENPLIESGSRDISISELEIRFQASLEVDELDTARDLLDEILELDTSNAKPFDDFDEELSALIESKDSFLAGASAFNNEDFARAIPLFRGVVPSDELRYAEAQSKLAQASSTFAAGLSKSVKQLVSKGFYISAHLEMEEANEILGPGSDSLQEITGWFTERFENAKANALNNEMAVRKDSFTGNVSYYYKPTYVTCCGGSLQAADRFRLVIRGDSNPWLQFNVMIYQDDWVFAEEIKANIDGEMWTIATDAFFGDTIERDNGSGSIWEYIYREATNDDIRYLIKARESKQTLVRFQGDKSKSDLTVTGRMKDGIEQVLLAYLALGGRLSL